MQCHACCTCRVMAKYLRAKGLMNERETFCSRAFDFPFLLPCETQVVETESKSSLCCRSPLSLSHEAMSVGGEVSRVITECGQAMRWPAKKKRKRKKEKEKQVDERYLSLSGKHVHWANLLCFSSSCSFSFHSTIK